MLHLTPPIVSLGDRRKQLRMTVGSLARLAGVSTATVNRVLAGRYGPVAFEAVARIAAALGVQPRITADGGRVGVDFLSTVSAAEHLERQAARKAEQIVRAVQGSSALEGQGLDADQLARMVEKTKWELLVNPTRRLWAA